MNERLIKIASELKDISQKLSFGFRTEPEIIEIRWDQIRGNEGWYVEVKDEYGHVMTNSTKRFFPVPVDAYDKSELKDLSRDLREEFPTAKLRRG